MLPLASPKLTTTRRLVGIARLTIMSKGKSDLPACLLPLNNCPKWVPLKVVYQDGDR